MQESTGPVAKNATRLASLMGTWTTWADTKASIGNYQVLAYFVVHFMPDPMADYACELPNCSERKNHICQRQPVEVGSNEMIFDKDADDVVDDNNNNDSLLLPQKRRKEELKCENISKVVSEWSDVAAFYYIGFHVHAGIPFRVEKVMDTGGWIGPYNLVMAPDDEDDGNINNIAQRAVQKILGQSMTNRTIPKKLRQQKRPLEYFHSRNQTTQQEQEQQKQRSRLRVDNSSLQRQLGQRQTNRNNGADDDDDDEWKLVDRYDVRYVNTVNTPLLTRHYPINNTLFLDWDSVMGTTAVHSTLDRQSTVQHGDNAYQPYQGSCQNGNLQPILPLYNFQFLRRSSSNATNNTSTEEEETVVVEVDYQFLVTPTQHNTAYRWMPWIQKRIRAEKNYLGFSMDGPFCYGDDPKRAYTISISMDSSSSSSSVLKIERGCIEGLPCLPPAALHPNNNNNNHSSTIHPARSATTTVLDLSTLLYQIGFWTLLVSWILYCCCCRCGCGRKQDEERRAVNHDPAAQEPLLSSPLQEPQEESAVPPTATVDMDMSTDEFVDCIDDSVSAPASGGELVASQTVVEDEENTNDGTSPPKSHNPVDVKSSTDPPTNAV